MNKQRYRSLKFGYQIKDGIITLHPTEAETVRWIYEMYLNGYSYQELAVWLTTDGIYYQEDDHNWNKNMVKRILEFEGYYTSEKYPPIIEADQWKLVQDIKERKAEKRAIKRQWPRAFRQNLICSQCGARIYRGNQGKSENWQCKKEGKITKHNITDEVLWGKVMEKQMMLMNHPEFLEITDTEPLALNLQTIQRNNEIIQQIKLKEKTEEEILEMIFEAATERYDRCSSGNEFYQTKKLLELYTAKEPGAAPDFELLEDSVKTIYLESSGEIYFEMINGKFV